MGGWQHVNPMGGLRGGTPPMQLKADLATALAENEEEQKKKKVAISKEAEQQKKIVTEQQATRLLHRKKVEHEVKKSQLYTFLVKCQINTHGAGGDIQVKLYKIVYLQNLVIKFQFYRIMIYSVHCQQMPFMNKYFL